MKNHVLFILLSISIIFISAQITEAADKTSAPSYLADQKKDEENSEFMKAIADGKILFDSRYRYEHVNQDGLPNDADANTVRARVGYETGKFYYFRALVEVEKIERLGSERYNDTLNGKTTYPTVADPEDTGLNRLQLTYSGVPDTAVTVGRQTISLDNQRFVGSGSWRQNDQTFDAISIKNQTIKDTTLFYAFSNQVNRSGGTNSPSGIWNGANIQLMNAAYTGLPFGKIIGYSYLLDIPDSITSSSATYGARFEGKKPLKNGMTGLLNLEYAHQMEYAQNPNNFGFNYYMVEPAITYGEFTVKAQYESIAGDGSKAMQFALGTTHTFDGWVNKFSPIPANGLVDVNIGVTYLAKSDNKYINGAKAALVYHDFSAEHGSANYGTEWNVLLEQTFEKSYLLGVQLGRYNADKFAADTTKIMPYAQVKF